MKQFLSYKSLTILAAIGVALIIPLTIVQVMQQQDLRQRATGVTWATNQSATTACVESGGIDITVTFSNTEPDQTGKSMTVLAKDLQTESTLSLGAIAGGKTKSGTIHSDQTTLAAGTVEFSLTWTDGQSGTDKRTATYKEVKQCQTPTPTSTATPSASPSATPTEMPTPPSSPTPTICPTLGPVKNVHIDCPNCK